MESFTTVLLLMRSSTAMNSSGLNTYPASVHSWPQTPKLLLPPPLLLLYSRMCPQPSSLPLLVLPSTVVSPSPSLWVLCHKLSLGRRTPEPYRPEHPVSSPPSVSGRTSRLLFLYFAKYNGVCLSFQNLTENVIAHQADLRFVNMAAQKFLDECKVSLERTSKLILNSSAMFCEIMTGFSLTSLYPLRLGKNYVSQISFLLAKSCDRTVCVMLSIIAMRTMVLSSQ